MTEKNTTTHTSSFIKLYRSKLHGIIATIVLTTSTAITQNEILHNLPFATDKKSALDQVNHAEPVTIVYGFSQADYNLIITARTLLKETKFTFTPIHVYLRQDKH